MHSVLSSLRMMTLVALLAIVASLAPQPVSAAVNPLDLDKGEWVWQLPQARSNTGTSTNRLFFRYLKNKGMKFVIVKCGDRGTWWSQFSSSAINDAHAEGLLIFGYQRVDGVNLTAEINVGKQCLATAADGYIIDAEVEFNGKKTQATQMMQSLRASYPTKFIAHAPLPIIDYHQNFPYVEFGTYCDAVMPQLYWQDIGVSPTGMVDWFEDQWHKWHNTWRSQGKSAAIKPIIPIGQGYDNVPSSQITQFVNLLNSSTTSPSPGGYGGVSFWSAQHHTTSQWNAIGAAVWNPTPPGGGGGGTEYIVDNGTSGFSASSNWYTATTSPGYYGSNYHVRSTASVSDSAAWNFTLPTSGSYTVYARWTAGSNRPPAAPFIVYHTGGSTTVNVNQQQNNNTWVSLGTYNFNSGTATRVRLSCWTTTGYYVIADAVKLVKQ